MRRLRYLLMRTRLHARAIRLKEVIGYLGLEEGIKYGEARGWILKTEGNRIWLRDP